MSTDEAPICGRCAGAMIYVGQISLPPRVIHRCEACGHHAWTENPRPPQVRAEPQQAQQQQQQPDITKKK